MESSRYYLAHYGVKGQKHGQRRYQNEDGSLTAEGRDHYGVGQSKAHGLAGAIAAKRSGGLGLHDKRGNKVSVKDNIKAGYKNSGRTAKAMFKMLFNKNSKSDSLKATGGVKKPSEDGRESKKSSKTSKQEKMRKVTNIFANAVKIGAAAALVGYGIKHRKTLKEAASLIKDCASDFGSFTKWSYHDAKANSYTRKADRKLMNDPYSYDHASDPDRRKAARHRAKADRFRI